MTEAPHARVRPPGKRLAIILAVLVHIGLAVFLIYGIRWQTKVQDVVEVDLVRPLPSPAPAPREEPKPEPRPEPKPAPKPEPKPEPKPQPKPLPPPPKPDIAIKDKEKPKPPPKEEPKPKFDPFRQQMLEEEKRLATQKQLAEEEAKLRQQRDQAAAQAASQAAAARSKALASYSDRIRAKIRGNIVLPPDLKGNPMAVFEVVQLPSGEVISARLVRTSGHPGYDAAVERAILKSSPLPLPDDKSLFERNLRLTFCPLEDGKCS